MSRVYNFLNQKKRATICILSLIFIFVMLMPIASVSIEDGNNSQAVNVSVLNASSKIQNVKDTLGISDIDTKGIDKQNPADDAERTLVALEKIMVNIDFSVALLVLSILISIIGAMSIYVKPNSIFSGILLLFSPLALIISNLSAFNAFTIVNKNIGVIKDYFGLNQNLLGFTYRSSAIFFVMVILSALIFIMNIALRKPQKENNESEKLTKFILAICAIASVLSVFFITLFLLIKGIPTISKIGFYEFIFTSTWDPTGDIPKFGIFNLILTSFVGTFGAILIGVPIGIFTAVFISQIVSEKLTGFLSGTINLLAGIPSVIYGAVGAILLVPFVQNVFKLPTGATLFSAIIVLSMMVLPTIVSVTVTSLNAVPKTYMEASLALGLTKEASIFKILIPAAQSGVMTGVLLGLGRAIGEAMAIILVAGNAPAFPKLFAPARFLTTGIVAEMGYATGLHRDALFAIGLVLFVFILIINSLFKYMIKKAGARYE